LSSQGTDAHLLEIFRSHPRDFVVLNPTWLFGRFPPPSRASWLRAGSPSPSGFRAHEAPVSTSGGGHPRDQPPWFDPRCPFLPLGRHREHYAGVAAGGKARRGDPGHQTV